MYDPGGERRVYRLGKQGSIITKQQLKSKCNVSSEMPSHFLSHLDIGGALDGGSQSRMSILRNANVTCLCRLFMPMSNVEFKKRLCPMSL